MITNLANLGASMRTTDLGAGSKKELGTDSQSGKIGQGSESFDKVFQNQRKNEDELRTNFAKPTPSPVKKDIDKAIPEKGITEKAAAKTNASETRTSPRKERDESGSVMDKERSEDGGENSSERDVKIRQSVMLDFMDSMESEFGIPPTRMVEAMTNLSDEALATSPEETAAQVIAQLDLSEEEKPEAMAMYMGLLAQLAQLQQQPKLQPAMVAGSAAAVVAAPALLNQQVSHHQRRAMLNQNLDKMNSQFFMQGPAALKPQGPTEAMLGQQAALPDSGLGESAVRDQVSLRNSDLAGKLPPQFDMQGKLPEMQMPQTPMKPEMNSNPDLNLQELGLESIDPNSLEAKELAKKLAALGAAAAALGEGMKADPNNMQALKAESAMNQMGLNGDLNSMKAEILSGDREQSEWGGSGQEGSGANAFMVHQNTGHGTHAKAQALGSDQQSFGALMAGAGAMGANAAADASDNKASIQQIMNQANFMIKKGGGEAKVQLNPEGLGEIHMKVSVNEGKVGIEMSAESKEAKKLIESSLGELKSSLGQHRLSMETVKVDVGNQASSDNKNSESQSQQRQMDQRQEQNQARDFWNQFNDGSRERRASFADNPGIRAYGGTRKVEPMTPDTTGTASVKRFSGSGKGRGLDLVA